MRELMKLGMGTKGGGREKGTKGIISGQALSDKQRGTHNNRFLSFSSFSHVSMVSQDSSQCIKLTCSRFRDRFRGMINGPRMAQELPKDCPTSQLWLLPPSLIHECLQ